MGFVVYVLHSIHSFYVIIIVKRWFIKIPCLQLVLPSLPVTSLKTHLRRIRSHSALFFFFHSTNSSSETQWEYQKRNQASSKINISIKKHKVILVAFYFNGESMKGSPCVAPPPSVCTFTLLADQVLQ